VACALKAIEIILDRAWRAPDRRLHLDEPDRVDSLRIVFVKPGERDIESETIERWRRGGGVLWTATGRGDPDEDQLIDNNDNAHAATTEAATTSEVRAAREERSDGLDGDAPPRAQSRARRDRVPSRSPGSACGLGWLRS
jgi:hypothetical protein